MLTALCVARAPGPRKGDAIAAVLRDAGAVDDVFTAAYLGDHDALDRALDDEPQLLTTPDPASDLYGATVVDHAAAGRDPATTLRRLADRGARAPTHGHHLLRHAAD